MENQNLFIVALEPLETRYTGQWYTHIPISLSKYAKVIGKPDINVRTISGTQVEDKVTPGAFLDFAATNIWKSSQMIQIGELFSNNQVKPNDIFLFTDFWNPTVIQLKYISELLQIPIKIIGIAHAGSYDPHDFLGRLIRDAKWIRHAEMSFYYSFDHLVFATQFHIDMFAKAFDLNLHEEQEVKGKIVRSGFPMEYFPEILEPFNDIEKENIILFPHRKAPEKQVNIFLDLAKEMPEYKWVVAQDKKLSKHEYHELLGKSKIVFSANLQETLGISSCAEGPLCNVVPIIPDRLSYSEIFEGFKDFLYPSDWTISWSDYQNNKHKLIEKIHFTMQNYTSLKTNIENFNKLKFAKYFSPDILYAKIFAN